MRLTRRTNLAMRVLMSCATNPDRLLRTNEVAALCNGSTNHVAHVVQALQTEGFIQTTRGRAGGIKLADSPEKLSIGAVFRVFEADIPFAECFDADSNTCPLTADCRLRNYIIRAVEAFYHELDMVTLDDLVKGNCGLQNLLAAAPTRPEGCSTLH